MKSEPAKSKPGVPFIRTLTTRMRALVMTPLTSPVKAAAVSPAATGFIRRGMGSPSQELIIAFPGLADGLTPPATPARDDKPGVWVVAHGLRYAPHHQIV